MHGDLNGRPETDDSRHGKTAVRVVVGVVQPTKGSVHE